MVTPPGDPGSAIGLGEGPVTDFGRRPGLSELLFAPRCEAGRRFATGVEEAGEVDEGDGVY